MKRILFFAFMMISSVGYCQLDHIKVLIFYNEAGVRQYMDSLFTLRHNSAYKIKNSVNGDGDLVLNSDFALDDQDMYTCFTMQCLFFRYKGTELCVKQILIGDVKYAQPNLNYIKDHFTSVSAGNWEMKVDTTLKIKASFERDENNGYPNYVISYDVVPQ